MEKNKVEVAANTIRKIWEKHGVKKPFRLLGFCLSLLPIPVISQAGTIIDRHLSDKELENNINAIWEELLKVNEKIETVDNLDAAILEIAKTVEKDQKLREKCEQLSKILSDYDTVFVIETQKNSYQELVKSVITAGRVLVSAENNSINTIHDTKINSPDTHLRAIGGSRNYINNSEFSDRDSSVGMQGIGVNGDVFVSGSSVGYGQNSMTEMGGWVMGTDESGNFVIGTRSPDLTATCPFCHNSFGLYRSDIIGKTRLQCPSCKLMTNIPPNY